MIYQIPPRQTTGKDYLAYWENFFTNEEINEILALPEWLNLQTASIGGSAAKDLINENVRRTNIAWVGLRPETKHIWEKLTNVIADVNNQFFKFDLTGCYEPMQLGVYRAEDKGHYDWHIDSSPTDKAVPRKLSMTLLLSDPSEFEGGQFQVKTCNDSVQTLEMVKGRAWFFPSYTLHRVTPVTKGIRRSLVLWVGGPEFK